MVDNEHRWPPALFARLDESADELFYQMPRFVQHIDAVTIAALTAYYSEILPVGAAVLDLMSSWISHLPAAPVLGRVAGLGMNADELSANPRLTDCCVHDLNRDPHLPYAATSFDAVLIAVSIQYLIDPIAVCADIARVMRPGGRLVIAMSHRCFPTKAIRAFQGIGGADRMRLVAAYLREAGGFATVECLDRSPVGADPLWLVSARTTAADVPAV